MGPLDVVIEVTEHAGHVATAERTVSCLDDFSWDEEPLAVPVGGDQNAEPALAAASSETLMLG